MLPFCCQGGLSNGKKPLFTGFFTGVKSFPLNGARGFARDVVHHAVDMGDLVRNGLFTGFSPFSTLEHPLP